MSDFTKRHLNWTACFNARDVGGYPRAGSGHTRWGALIRADTLCRLTAAGQHSLIDYGVKTIIDLRSARELEAAPNPFSDSAFPAYNLSYHHLPLMNDADEAAMAALQEARSQAEHYCLSLDHFSANIAAIARTAACAEPGGVVVHCHAGKDRTGVLVAVLLALAGVPARAIAQDYALSEGQLRPMFEELYLSLEDPLEKERASEWFQARPETMLAVLAHLQQRHGGAESYLRAAGLEDGELARLRERLREPNP